MVNVFKVNIGLSCESFDRLQDVMEEAGELNRRVEFEAIVDNTMVPKS